MTTSTNQRPTRWPGMIAGTLVLALTVAHAPVYGAVSYPDADSAQRLYAEGVRLESTDLPAARDRFKGAFKLKPSPIIGLKLGDVHERLGELVEALQVYRRAETVRADEFLDVGIREESQKAKDARAEAGRRAEALGPRIPSVTVRLENMPPGGHPKVLIDDAEVPVEVLAVPRSVNPGKHVVVVTIEGQPANKNSFELVEGQTRVLSMDLTPDAPTDTAKASNPKVNAVVATTTPAAPAPGGRQDDGARSSLPSTMTWVGFGVGGAAIIVGGVTGILALGKDSTVKSNCPNQICPPAFHDDLNSAKTFSTISTVSFGVGLIGIGVGVWGLISTSSSAAAVKPATSASVQPWIGIGTIGVTGAF